jgi:hypothetical protein
MESERWIIGPEYDRELVRIVRDVLKDVGYEEIDSWQGIGGSQEITHVEYEGHNGRLILEAVTFVGLSLQGPSDLISAVRREHEKRLNN